MDEIWKDIPGYEGLYQASNLGRIKSLDRVIMRKNGFPQTWKGRILKPKHYPNGYLFVNLHTSQKAFDFLVHRAVAITFIPNPNKYPNINHKDENKENNSINNLEWCTQKYNLNYGNCKEKQKESKIQRGYIKTIYQYSLDGNLIASYESCSEATRKTGINNLSAACLGKYTQAGGFLWSYSSIPPKLNLRKTSSRIVYLLNDEGVIVKEYASMREAAREHNTHHHQIGKWCRSDNPYWKLKYE